MADFIVRFLIFKIVCPEVMSSGLSVKLFLPEEF